MNYTKQPKETRYAGTLFRSRLEARWAAFFDLAGWRWTYEPCDFDGWSPDFLLDDGDPIYVEVKPIGAFCEKTAAKIERSGCVEQCWLLGLSPNQGPSSHGAEVYPSFRFQQHPRCGWLGSRECVGGMFWETAVLAYYNENEHSPLPGRLGMIGEEGAFYDRINLRSRKGGMIGDWAIGACRLQQLWGLAHEKTRFTY